MRRTFVGEEHPVQGRKTLHSGSDGRFGMQPRFVGLDAAVWHDTSQGKAWLDRLRPEVEKRLAFDVPVEVSGSVRLSSNHTEESIWWHVEFDQEAALDVALQNAGIPISYWEKNPKEEEFRKNFQERVLPFKQEVVRAFHELKHLSAGPPDHATTASAPLAGKTTARKTASRVANACPSSFSLK